MAADYGQIKQRNIERYGTDIGRIGPMLLADRYDDRTHFIFELLQNAEDAHKRRKNSFGPRSVSFRLTKSCLYVAHSGEPFGHDDVRGICGIGESTKSRDLTAIGRFGIGFKAVYAFTDAPEVHSGSEHFAVDSFVWPRPIDPIPAADGQTIFVFPFRTGDQTAFTDIASGLEQLGARTLLFLREIEEIEWSVDGGAAGLYLRGKPEKAAPNARFVSLIGEAKGQPAIEETWLLFEQPVYAGGRVSAGHVEIAFNIVQHRNGLRTVRRINDSTVVVYFPTIVPTNLGFLLQGPYRTTPSRDNIPRNDEWNQGLIGQTADMLGQALFTIKELGLLDSEFLRTLPIDRAKFGDGAMLTPLFERARQSLSNDDLLPRFGGGFASARTALLGRGQ